MTPLDEQLAPLRDPGNDIELAHVLYERAQRIDIDGLIVEDLIGLGIDHMRAVERDEQAVVGARARALRRWRAGPGRG